MTTTIQYLSYDLHVDISRGTAFLRCRQGDGPVRPATSNELAEAKRIAGNAKERQDALVTDVTARCATPMAIRRKSAPRLSEVK